ncbi:CLAVATA3/ESR (CLE)-related protein 46-like [Punica granatum]|uniref:CLAVATA3/ESR (CLE)-related protein 46-like n=1 Tax=Punica granatum TaxID=22663 RepID=A0A6P8E4H2_PUNGR|nr:CLAVATA3/ESR (CLE)-related protein 46-like [Punica granatum]
MPSNEDLPLHHTVAGMRRKEAAILRVLLLVMAWLLLAASEHHFLAFADARAIRSADSKLGPDRQNLYIPQENIRSTMGGEKKIRKPPSGPNPVGNQRPPTEKH